jgi:transposase
MAFQCPHPHHLRNTTCIVAVGLVDLCLQYRDTADAGVKTLRSQKLRMLLTHRKLLPSKAIAIENDLRGTLRNFGLKVGRC